MMEIEILSCMNMYGYIGSDHVYHPFLAISKSRVGSKCRDWLDGSFWDGGTRTAEEGRAYPSCTCMDEPVRRSIQYQTLLIFILNVISYRLSDQFDSSSALTCQNEMNPREYQPRIRIRPSPMLDIQFNPSTFCLSHHIQNAGRPTAHMSVA